MITRQTEHKLHAAAERARKGGLASRALFAARDAAIRETYAAGGSTLGEIARACDLTTERVRQIVHA